MLKTIYICYFGVREPLVQTQVIPYLVELSRDSDESVHVGQIFLLTFEPTAVESDERDRISSDLRAKGIVWTTLKYHKTPSLLATAFDVFMGAIRIRRFINRNRIDVLHCRVHIPALMGTIARMTTRHKPKLIFDIRGFLPEEYVDAGIWSKNGLVFRLAKSVERYLLRTSDGFVVLTEKARSILFPESKLDGFSSNGRPVEVIPCCVEPSRFETTNEDSRNTARKSLGLDDKLVIAYVGSFGGWYLSDELIDFLDVARTRIKAVHALILTQRNTQDVEDRLVSRGFQKNQVTVKSVSPAELPRYLSAADIAISFIKPCYSKLSSSPTKIAEYLACGIPIMSNKGIGDVDDLITSNRLGVLLERFDNEAYSKSLHDLIAMKVSRSHCREIALKEFDIETVGGFRYRRLYCNMFAGRN